MEVSLSLTINKILTEAAKRRAIHIHLAVGTYPVLRVDDSLVELNEEKIITANFMNQLAAAWLDEEELKTLDEKKGLVFVKEIEKNFRVRVNFFFQKGVISGILHIIPGNITSLAGLGFSSFINNLVKRDSGLILVCGPYGSGRTSTVVSMIEEINKTEDKTITTIEKPIEYLINNQKSLIEQREVGRDVVSFTEALRYAMHSDANILFVDSNQETESIPLILDFANSGRLIFSIMDCTSVTSTIEAIISAFPTDEKNKGRNLLANSLISIICLRLVPRVGGGLVLANEVLIANDAVRSIIKDGKLSQLKTVLQSSRVEGMTSLDQSLAELVKSGDILVDKAIEYVEDANNFRSIVRS